MTRFEMEVEQLPADDQLKSALAQVIGSDRDEISIAHEDFDAPEEPIACTVFKRDGGAFEAMVSVATDSRFATVLETRSALEIAAGLAALLQARVLTSNDDTNDPYSMVLVDSTGEAAIVDVDGEEMDDRNRIRIRRTGPLAPILRLSRDAIVSMLLENGICSMSDIEGQSEDEVAAAEHVIGTRFPWQFRECLLAMGRSAGSYLRDDDFFVSNYGSAAERLQRFAADQTDLQPLVDALKDGRGIFPLTVSSKGFRCFRLNAGQDPVIYEWSVGMNWPRPVWPTLSGFLVASARALTAAR